MNQASPSSASVAAEAGFTFAHLSDPHLTSLDGVRPGALLNKRLLGYLSWRGRRRGEHRKEVLEALLVDLHRHRPHQVLVTGDLTQLGLPREFAEAAAWLPRLGPPDKVLLVPGNHDCYVRTPWAESFALWHDYLDDMEGVAGFPRLRCSGDVAFIGVSSARPTPPFLATGSLGRDQLRRLEDLLRETGEAGLTRILLIHHPPLAETVGWRKRLTDGPALRALLARTGVELILHGHAHRSTLGALPTPAGPAPVIGVPSASALGHRPDRRARYHLCRIRESQGVRRLEVTVRGLDGRQGTFVEREHYSLQLPASPVPE